MRHPALRALVAITLAFCSLAVSGCTARHIRDAQNSFNEAAAAENQLRLDRSPRSGLRDASGAAANYKLALAAVNRELDDNEASLQSENLLGTALVLKALSLWRIADLDGSDASGNEMSTVLAVIARLVDEKALVLGTRDRVLVKALPGLRDHDRGLRATTYQAAQSFFESSLTTVEDALVSEKPPENHPIRTYLRLAQLSTLVAWKDAVFGHFKTVEDQKNMMTAPNARFDEITKKLKPRWATDSALYPAIVQLAKEMGRTPPPE